MTTRVRSHGSPLLDSSPTGLGLAAEASVAGMWAKNLQTGEEWWSPRLFELLGFGPGEIDPTGEALVGVVHPQDRQSTRDAIDQQTAGNAQLDVHCRLRTEGGAYRWFHIYGAISRGADGAPQRMVATLTDVHDREMARTELDRFFALSMDLVCVIDVDGYLSRVNPSFTDTLGYLEDELLDLPLLDFVHPDDVEDTISMVGELAQGRGTRGFQNRCKHKGGHWVWLSWTARPDSTGHIYAIGRDVTEERRARDELARRAAELESTNEELEQFAYVASHDLQEPLRTIASYADLVETRYAATLDDDGREFLAFMSEAANRMRTLILALLDYSRLGRRDLEPEVLDAASVVRCVIQDLHAAVADSGARITVDSLPSLAGDPLLLPLVFQNLILNAIRFRMEAPPRIRISAERAPVGWRFDVEDNGIGVPELHRERVFEVFKRLHPRARYEGTGIGLAVCRRIVQQHGGSIWCVANPAGGSIFRFTIPALDRKP